MAVNRNNTVGTVRLSRRLTAWHPVKRRGMALVVALVTLAILGLVFGSLMQNRVQYQSRLKRRQQQLQAEWLAESAIRRAVFKLRSDPAYVGDSWTISAAQLQSALGGGAEISVRGISDVVRGPGHAIEVRAYLGAPEQPAVRVSRRADLYVD